MSHVELRDIQLSLGDVAILDHLDFRVPDEVLTRSGHPYVVLLGASGCGKSTTLRIIAGLLAPDAGEVILDRKDATAVAPRRRDVAMVFQNDALYPHLTIHQSLKLSARRIKERDQRVKQVELAIELAGIAALVDRRPDRLSGGELRRASIAKMIARNASVRLLDEPLSASTR